MTISQLSTNDLFKFYEKGTVYKFVKVEDPKAEIVYYQYIQVVNSQFNRQLHSSQTQVILV